MPDPKRGKSLLDGIRSPDDIRGLTLQELVALAGEIRARIIEVVAAKGGHFGASMGAVELTLALHKVFRAPEDIIIWDVGHQAYPHKMLTGRLAKLETLRQLGGLAGFPRRDESPYDTFGVGHAGTSISAAVGYAAARDLLGNKNKVIAVIGDAGIANGMAFEAMNHLGHLNKDVLVILNDNEMSISPSVGAMTRYLNRIITDPRYRHFRQDVNKVLHKVPRVGDHLARAAKHLEGSVLSLMGPGGFFEDLGFSYIGPVDGHNLGMMIEVLEKLRNFDKPTLLHVVTVKGKGYAPAEKDRSVWHGVTPFNKETGEILKKASPAPAFTKVFASKLTALAAKDPKVVAITAAMLDGTGLVEFQKAFPDRCFDVGIAEGHAVTLAAGMACGGLKPVCAIYSTFLQRGYDQVIHDVCLQKLPVIFALDRGGIVGEDGETHQGVFDLTYMRPLPAMRILAPAFKEDLEEMLETCLSRSDGPVSLRYHRGTCPPTPAGRPAFEWGRGALLREGKDLALIAAGWSVHESLQASDILAQNGISAAVADVRSVKPLDRELIVSLARKFSKLVTVEENAAEGGMGSAVLELLAEEGLKPGVLVLGLPDRNIAHGAQDKIRAMHHLDAAGIAAQALAFSGSSAQKGRNRLRKAEAV